VRGLSVLFPRVSWWGDKLAIRTRLVHMPAISMRTGNISPDACLYLGCPFVVCIISCTNLKSKNYIYVAVVRQFVSLSLNVRGLAIGHGSTRGSRTLRCRGLLGRNNIPLYFVVRSCLYTQSSFPRHLLAHRFKPLNAELNPICHLLALLGAHHILNVSG